MAAENKIPLNVKFKAGLSALVVEAALLALVYFGVKLLKFVLIEHLALNVPNKIFAYVFIGLAGASFVYALNINKRKLEHWQKENAPSRPLA